MPHLVPKDLTALPFVDRVPDPNERPDQRRIEWIRNGECLGAAEHINDNKGELNRGPVQVQKNASTLMDNEKVIDSSLREIIERVNSHDDALGSIGDDNLADKVQELEEKVEPFEAEIKANKLAIFIAGETIKANDKKVGVRPDEDPTTRDVMNDLLFVKKEMGNYSGKDFNGNDVPGVTETSGMKARIINNGLSIAQNTRRIAQLEDDWIQSDVGALTANIEQIRQELGQTDDAPTDSVYEWIKESDTKQKDQDTDIERLKVAVGIDSGSTETLDQRISTNTAAIATNQNSITENSDKIRNIETKIGDSTTPQGMEYRLIDTERKVSTLNNIVGQTDDDGLRKKVQDVMDEIGDDGTVGSIKGRIVTNENNILTDQRSIATLQTQIGNSTAGSESGLFKRIGAAEEALFGDGQGSKGLSDIVVDLAVEVADKVADVDSDGKTYARSDKAWVEITNDSIEEAPQDDKSYVRKTGTWVDMFQNGLVLPANKNIVFTVGNNTIEAMSAVDGKIVVGVDANKVELKGTVEPFKVGAGFKISSGAANTDKIHILDDTITLGSNGVQTVVSTGAGKTFQVNVGAQKYDVLHKGNFADNTTATPMVRVEEDWKPLSDYANSRARGGMYFENSTAQLDLKVDTPSAVTANVVPVLFGWSVDFVNGSSGFTYRGDTSKVFQSIVQAEVETVTDDTEIEFHLYKNDVDTNIRYIIKGRMWNTDNTAYAFINLPLSLQKDDTLKIYAVARGKDSTIKVKSATMYLTEM